jgi:hypothetical protein
VDNLSTFNSRGKMTRILPKIVAMGLLVLITYGILWLIPPKPYLVYASVLDKEKRLASLPAPRLIFVGGSGVALGLDSQLIETEMKMPVINMGVNAGFGLHYMFEQVKPWIRAGDIILIVPEYEHFYGELIQGDQNLLWALCIQPSMLRTLSRQQMLHLLPELPGFAQQRLQELVRTKADPIYNRSAFNVYGDFVNHLDLPPTPLLLSSIAEGQPLNGKALFLLKEFYHYTQKQGVKAYLIYPAIAESFWNYPENRKAIETLQLTILQQNIIQPLSTPIASVWPDALFFDTVYHLSRQGRQRHSEMIVQHLLHLQKRYLFSHPAPSQSVTGASHGLARSGLNRY